MSNPNPALAAPTELSERRPGEAREDERPLETSLSPWIRDRQRSLLRQLVALVAQPGIVSLAGGLPDPSLFPTAEIAKALSGALAADPRALQYGPPNERLRESIVALMARRGVRCRAEEVFLVTGAQQGIDTLGRMLIEPGATVLLEEMTYTGAQQAFAAHSPRLLTVPTDTEHGIDSGAVEGLLEAGERPALLYLIPDAHNPMGTSIAPDRRAHLVELARRHRLPLVEDDPYGLLAYDGAFAPPLRALDDRWTLYVGSFSKILAPGLRLGWVIAPEWLASRFSVVKEASDLECSGLTQRAVAGLLDRFDLDAHLERLRAVYRERRDAMLAALERHFEGGATWTRPSGGMFVWLELGQGVLAPGEDTLALMHRCVRTHRVAFVPGSAFAAGATGGSLERARRSARLSFSTLNPAEIDQAVAAIAASIKEIGK